MENNEETRAFRKAFEEWLDSLSEEQKKELGKSLIGEQNEIQD